MVAELLGVAAGEGAEAAVGGLAVFGGGVGVDGGVEEFFELEELGAAVAVGGVDAEEVGDEGEGFFDGLGGGGEGFGLGQGSPAAGEVEGAVVGAASVGGG